tara:strand:+ start:82 stop:309 length:228 start_codon:yes stop_codon:yes gene_type:complete
MDILLIFGVLLCVAVFLLVVLPFVIEDSPILVSVLLFFPFGLLHFVVGLGWGSILLCFLILILPLLFYKPYRQKE